jgi:hypothetical protein
MNNPQTKFRATGERRRKARIHLPLPVYVSGVDATGQEFRTHTLLDNLSSVGLYMQLPRNIKAGAELEMLIQYSDEPSAARIAATGVVRRSEECPHGLYGLGIEFINYEFRPPSSMPSAEEV